MSKRLPISLAQDIARFHGCQQVIIVAWDGERTHVVTYGKSVEECDQAAQGGDRVKRALNWPAELLGEEPHRVTKLKERIRELEAIIAESPKFPVKQ